MEEGLKLDKGKVKWSLLPWPSLRVVAEVMTFGAVKYAPDNWQKVKDPEPRYFDAAMRHLTAWKTGEKLDAETGLPHLAHAACCVLFLIWFGLDGGDK